MYEIKYAAFTHPGRRSGGNEDNFYADGIFRNHLQQSAFSAVGSAAGTFCVFAVCDGMGGYAHGELASFLAIEAVAQYTQMCRNKGESLFSGVGKENTDFFVTAANESICRMSRRNRKESGSTLVLLECFGDVFTAANIGDSRVYRLRDGRLKQLSVDHTVVARMLAAGQIRNEEVKGHPRAHQLTQYLGISPEEMILRPAILQGRIKEHDRYLLCSDGLTDMVTDDRIEKILREAKTPREGAELLEQEALKSGGNDNITVIVLETAVKAEEKQSLWKRFWTERKREWNIQ